MAEIIETKIETGNVKICFSDSSDGDFRTLPDAEGLSERRARIVAEPWSWLHQVHGDRVLVVNTPGEHAGSDGDGLLTTTQMCPISVKTADCAPVVLVSSVGVAVVHAGWRGLLGGIIENAAQQLNQLGGTPIGSYLGPCIHPASYEFGLDELWPLEQAYGSAVRATTSSGLAALDMQAAVAAACEKAGWPTPPEAHDTTSQRWFSHRLRADTQRQVTVAWIEA